MRRFSCLLVALNIAFCLNGQDSAAAFKSYSSSQFKSCGMDINGYGWHVAGASKQFNLAEKDFRISKGMLGGGLACGFAGAGLVVAGTLDARHSSAIGRAHLPLIASGIALDIVAMPVCFVLRDVMLKKAAKRVRSGMAKLSNP